MHDTWRMTRNPQTRYTAELVQLKFTLPSSSCRSSDLAEREMSKFPMNRKNQLLQVLQHASLILLIEKSILKSRTRCLNILRGQNQIYLCLFISSLTWDTQSETIHVASVLSWGSYVHFWLFSLWHLLCFLIMLLLLWMWLRWHQCASFAQTNDLKFMYGIGDMPKGC